MIRIVIFLLFVSSKIIAHPDSTVSRNDTILIKKDSVSSSESNRKWREIMDDKRRVMLEEAYTHTPETTDFTEWVDYYRWIDEIYLAVDQRFPIK